MRNIDDIVKGCHVTGIKGEKKTLTGRVLFDSREAGRGDLFVAVPGTKADGHDFIPSVVSRGVSHVVCEVFPEVLSDEVCYIQVEDSRRALALIASNYYDNPSSAVKLVGVTGTNGKTTVATLLYDIARGLGYKAGLLSTVNVRFDGKTRAATHTTPDPLQLQSVMREMADSGCEFVFMEVSSHTIHQRRIEGLLFRGGIFTNLTHDHLDYHKTFRDYLEAKKMFFDHLPASAFALVNTDDRNGRVMVQNTRASVHSYAMKSMADYRGKILESHFEGNLLQVNNSEFWTRLPGLFNAYNVLAVYGTGVLLGFDEQELMEQISLCMPVDGRFEIIRKEGGPTAVVDYAHTPDALENVLSTILGIRKKDQQVITIVGAGGNRDRTKRPEMARIAAELSDKVVLTSDNPRDEDPAGIIREMKDGLTPELGKKVITINDRDEAIRATCAFAGKNDIILVAGKGHETYQEIKGVRHHFDDREKLRNYLNV
ncbi:MAG TPA: UDP-N-acetylmuramoyl-L-alanyl-D-glutamate--2,6-diaminopimelate ligase [Bacteroidales bacterium]|nr:UDP-N-acetylmuramoyl-L-alanyl-D-glutamate--2,6-diaminopimelate ligase [Bacteroidales bacterium]